MKTYILPLLMMMLISCSNSKHRKMKAQRYLCPKAKKSISPKTCEAWTCKTPKANGAITAWHVPKTSSSLGKGFGDNLSDPPQLEGHSMKVNLKNLEEKLEHFYHYFYHTLQFAKTGSKCDKYRMMVMINYSLEGTAYGGDYDGEIGALWIAPTGYRTKS